MPQPEAFGSVSELGKIGDETLAASLMKQAAARAARERQGQLKAPTPPKWLGANAGFPTFTTSAGANPANYYNAAATTSGVR